MPGRPLGWFADRCHVSVHPPGTQSFLRPIREVARFWRNFGDLHVVLVVSKTQEGGEILRIGPDFERTGCRNRCISPVRESALDMHARLFVVSPHQVRVRLWRCASCVRRSPAIRKGAHPCQSHTTIFATSLCCAAEACANPAKPFSPAHLLSHQPRCWRSAHCSASIRPPSQENASLDPILPPVTFVPVSLILNPILHKEPKREAANDWS